MKSKSRTDPPCNNVLATHKLALWCFLSALFYRRGIARHNDHYLFGNREGLRVVQSSKIGAFALVLLFGCSSSWTNEERSNAQHFFRALDAKQEFTRLTNMGQPGVVQTGVEEILHYQREALREARLVNDSVLDKAHPKLRQHLRNEFERGIELVIRSAEMGFASKTGPTKEQFDLALAGTTLMNQWSDWLNANRSDIHIPEVR